jgi:hypothetical protein
MGDNVANQDRTSDGKLGAVQLSDGSHSFTSVAGLYYDSIRGFLHSDYYEGDGSLLTNLTSRAVNILDATAGQVVYYVSSNVVSGDVGFTYSNVYKNLTVAGNLVVGGDLYVTGNTYASNNVVFNDSIIQIGNSAPAFTTLGTLLSRPAGNVMMAYLSTEDGSAYMNTLTFGYTFGSPSGTLLVPDTSNNLEVRVFGNVTANTFFWKRFGIKLDDEREPRDIWV